MKKLSVFMMVLAAVPLLMTGCKKEEQNQASNVKFKLTDAPGQFDALNIDIKGIEVHSQQNGWVTFNSSLGVVNILNYVNGSSTVVAEGNIQAGNIDQVRLLLGTNNSVVVNGTTHQLQSSGSLQTALTLNLNNTLQSGGSYEWTIDFDAAQSIFASGGTGSTSTATSFQLNPVIRLIVDQSSFAAGGNITGSGSTTTTGGINTGGGATSNGGGTVVVGGGSTGSISGSLSAAILSSVCITGSNGSSIWTMTDLTGHFSIQAVSTGAYSVTITPVVSLLGSAHTISNINVTAGQTTNVGVINM